MEDYISLKMDGSAIFSIYKREFLTENHIEFTSGYHEDVYFMFLVYYYAKSIACCNFHIYNKTDREDSIIHTISEKHIDGFFLAYQKIFDVISKHNHYLQEYHKGLIAVAAVKIRDIYRFGIDRTHLYKYLYDKLEMIEIDDSNFIIETKYLKIVKSFMDSMQNGLEFSLLELRLKDMLECSWSCYDLHNSLFLASDEVRACCKRFFVNGIKKGDVVLYKIDMNDKTDSMLDHIIAAKKDLFRKINAGDSNECSGCPHLSFKKWGNISNIEKISFEHHSICNMRCSYCSPKYYGGKKTAYNIGDLIKNLIETDSIKSCKSIVWAGGEPTMESSFDNSIETVSNHTNVQQMVITNALRHSNVLQILIDNSKAKITTSIDSGYEATFKKIRGTNGLKKVLNNLSLYANKKPQNITVKYILMEENSAHDEILEFVHLIKSYNLAKCIFHISCNFNESKISNRLLIAACLLYGSLQANGTDIVFFDELLRERICISAKEIESIKHSLAEYDLSHIIEDPKNYTKICLFGNNTQTKLLLQKSIFLQHIDDICIIDNHSIGDVLLNKTICNPKDFVNSDYPILISAVQGTYRIHKEFIDMGFDTNRLIRGIIL